MTRKALSYGALLVFSLIAARPAAAATIMGGTEDWPGSSGVEHNGDFNDVMFKITGNVAFNAPGGIFNNLTPAVVNETGTVFWDNPSGDGHNQNVGFQMLGFGAQQYLATSTGGVVNSVAFTSTGTLTVTMLGGITGNAAADTLGWYDPSNPTVLHQLFGNVTPGATITFTPTASFVLYSGNGLGQVFSSIAAANVQESANQEHFAFFTVNQASVPEPSTVLLAGMGLMLVVIGSARRAKK